MKRLLSLIVVSVSMALAQAPAPTPISAAAFAIGIGGGYNTSGYNGAGAQKAAALIDFAYQPTGSNYWILTTLVTQPGKTSGVNTLRAGVGYSLRKSGNWDLIALADAGGTASSTSLLMNVGGGLKALYDLGGINKSLTGIHIGPGLRIAAISGTSVQPEYFITISKKF